jgi:predicted amidohydrolase
VLVALASLNQVWEDKPANLLSCERLLQKAKNHNVELIIFPEMTLTGFSMQVDSIAEEAGDSATLESFKALALNYGIKVIFGVVLRKNDSVSNNAIFLDHAGEVGGVYRKIHPFSFSQEDSYFEAGNEIVSLDAGSLHLGITICYDLRFPEIYTALGVKSDLIINIANWPTKRLEHWMILLKARAIENQVFVAGINRIGTDPNNNEYVKSSIIVHPNGEVLTPIYSEEQLDIYEINKEMIAQFKREFSTTKDRRPDFYKSIL